MNGLPAKSQRIYPRDWTDSVVYDGFHGLDRTGWAWQWLKRNREFSSHLQECSFLVDKPVMLKPRIVRSRCNQKLMPWRLMFCRPEDRRRYLVSAEQSLRFGRTCITYVDKGRSRFIRHFQILCLSYTSYHARQLPTFSAGRSISSSSNSDCRRHPSRGTSPFAIYHFRYEAPERAGACLATVSCILSLRTISKRPVSRRTTRTALENDAPGLGWAAGWSMADISTSCRAGAGCQAGGQPVKSQSGQTPLRQVCQVKRKAFDRPVVENDHDSL